MKIKTSPLYRPREQGELEWGPVAQWTLRAVCVTLHFGLADQLCGNHSWETRALQHLYALPALCLLPAFLPRCRDPGTFQHARSWGHDPIPLVASSASLGCLSSGLHCFPGPHGNQAQWELCKPPLAPFSPVWVHFSQAKPDLRNPPDLSRWVTYPQPSTQKWEARRAIHCSRSLTSKKPPKWASQSSRWEIGHLPLPRPLKASILQTKN